MSLTVVKSLSGCDATFGESGFSYSSRESKPTACCRQARVPSHTLFADSVRARRANFSARHHTRPDESPLFPVEYYPFPFPTLLPVPSPPLGLESGLHERPHRHSVSLRGCRSILGRPHGQALDSGACRSSSRISYPPLPTKRPLAPALTPGASLRAHAATPARARLFTSGSR